VSAAAAASERERERESGGARDRDGASKQAARRTEAVAISTLSAVTYLTDAG
jgi:hypothetical protein